MSGELRTGDPKPLFWFRETRTFGGTGAIVINIFQVHGAVLMVDHIIKVVDDTLMTNLTAVYADIYDGTVNTDITANGLDLSSAPVGSIFVKDQIATQPYSIIKSDQGRLHETIEDRKVGKPYMINAKQGVDTFIRFHYTTTHNPCVFSLQAEFSYEPVLGGYLDLLI